MMVDNVEIDISDELPTQLQFPYALDHLTQEAKRIIVRQLGYVPHNLVDVGASTPLALPDSRTLHFPLIAIVYPLNANSLKGRYHFEGGLKPFPTTLWMVCPVLHSEVSKLEDHGCIATLQARLSDSPLALQAMEIAHTRYAQYRWSLLTAEDKGFVESQGW